MAEDTMDDTILATLHDLQEREGLNDTPASGKESATADASTGSPSKEDVKAAADTTRARDESGKFTKQDKPATAEPAVATAPSKEGVETQTAAAPSPEFQQDMNRAPSSWKPAAKAAWANLPPEIRAEVHRRETEFHQGNRGIKEVADFGQSVQKIVEPYRGMILAEGGTPERAIEETLKTAALFRMGTPQAKLNAVIALCNQFNVPLNEYIQHVTGQQPQQQQQQFQPQQFSDPRVDTILASLQSQERERSARAEAASSDASQRFLDAKDDKGQPLYPFVDNVLDDMSNRVSFIRRQNPAISHDEALKQAYDAAVWANPETRAVLISQQQAQAQLDTANLRKVEEAKRANAGNMPKRGSLPAGEVLGSMDDTIRDTWRQLNG